MSNVGLEDKNISGKEQLVSFKLKSGLSTSAILAVLYAIFIFTPASLYLQLTIGQAGIPASWFTLILVVEIARIVGKPLTKQEAFLVFSLAGITYAPIWLVYNAWLRESDIAYYFGYAEKIPIWVSPPREANILKVRTFLHPDWTLPIVVMLLSSIIGVAFEFALGIFGRELFIEQENLPFPMQAVSCKAIEITTVEEDFRPLGVLAAFAVIGLIWGGLLYTTPFIIQAWSGQYFQVIPIPWIDMTMYVRDNMPGAILGIATDLGPIAMSWILPTSTVAAMIAGSLAVYFFGNYFIVTQGLSAKAWWSPKLDINLIYQNSMINFWVSPIIGFSLAAGIAPLIFRWRSVARAISAIRYAGRDRSRKRTEPLPLLWLSIIPMVVCSVALAAMYAILAPDLFQSFPYITVLCFILPFLSSLIAGRVIGETGVTVSPGANFTNAIFYLSGYKGVNGWFVGNWSPFYTRSIDRNGSFVLSNLKLAQLTETKSMDYIKMFWLMWPLAMLIGFLFMELFWRMAPIPSARYPATRIFWPIYAITQSVWIGGEAVGVFQVQYLLSAFFIGVGLYAVQHFLPIPFSYIALAAGINTVSPFAITMLIGEVLKQIIKFIIGKEKWNQYRTIAAAGLYIGEGIAVTVGVSIAVIVNSIWTSTY